MALQPPRFDDVVARITEIGWVKHTDTLLARARANAAAERLTLRDLPPPEGDKAACGLVIAAGPSLHRRHAIQRVLDGGFRGTIIAVDASYVACVRQGLVPDYVITLDPHLTRVVRWFGDKELERHAAGDDYFERQDLDVEFRKDALSQNLANLELVDRMGQLTKAIVASSAPANVVERLEEARFASYWWNPLVDDPRSAGSLTRQLFEINRWPSMNTGGNVGSAAWVFAASILKLPHIGLVGMDLGYYADTPLRQTQTYYELAVHLGTEAGIEQYFQDFVFPLTGERFFCDPTYYWYRKNLLQMMQQSAVETYNCTEGGTLFGDGLRCVPLESFLQA